MNNSSLAKVLYTAHTHVTGGRVGRGTTSDGALDVELSTPGSGRPGTNPEQLFGIAWSSCFIGALGKAASVHGVKLPADTSVDAEVSLGVLADDQYQLAVVLNVNLPGLDESIKGKLVETAHQTCPYSRMTRGNVEVELAIAA